MHIVYQTMIINTGTDVCNTLLSNVDIIYIAMSEDIYLWSNVYFWNFCNSCILKNKKSKKKSIKNKTKMWLLSINWHNLSK